MSKKSKEISFFTIFNTAALVFVSLLCILPLIHIAAISFSSSSAAAANSVTFWPVGFSLSSYQYVGRRAAFWVAMLTSVERIILGGAINLLLTILVAYPLSKEAREFRFRTFNSRITLNTGTAPGRTRAQILSSSPNCLMIIYQGISPPPNSMVMKKAHT